MHWLRHLCLSLAAAPILWSGAVQAQTVVAAHLLKAQTVLTAEDVKLEDAQVAGALKDPARALGLETRATIYAGQPIRPADLGPPAVVERNQKVTIAFQRGALTILAEGRALARAGEGETIRVMNTASKATVLAVIGADGTATVVSP